VAPTAPVKLLPALVSVIALAPALKVAAPAAAACVSAPVCVIAPLDVTVSVPLPTPEAPSCVATLLVRLTLFAPELIRLTAPVKALVACVRVIAPAPALNVDAPPTVSAVPAFCVIAPLVVTPKVPAPVVMLPRVAVVAAVSDTLPPPLVMKFAPPAVNVTAPAELMVTLPPLLVMVPGDPPAWKVTLPPAPEVTMTLSWPAVEVIELLSATAPAAVSVRVAFPPADFVIVLVVVMVPACAPAAPVVIVTSVPRLSAPLIVALLAVAVLPVGVKTSGLPPPNAPLGSR